MISNHIHHALDQDRELKQRLLADRLFLGDSGTARIASGVIAFFASLYMGSSHVPQNPWIHCAWWAGILLAGLLLNYGALVIGSSLIRKRGETGCRRILSAGSHHFVLQAPGSRTDVFGWRNPGRIDFPARAIRKDIA